MLLLRQIAVLIWKNILIALVRHPFSTPLRAFILPLIFGWFLSYARNFFIPPSVFGIGTASPVLSLHDAFIAIPSRDTLAFVNNGHTGGDIGKVINEIGDAARGAGKIVVKVEAEEDLLDTCRSSLRGTTRCIAGIIFHSSPTEGQGARWNYTMRADGSLGGKVVVGNKDNEQQLFIIPLQHAIDFAIARTNSTGASSLPDVQELPYTSLSQAERAISIRKRYNDALISLLGVAFFIGICGILYQQVGAQATEREIKIAPLLEVMMPNVKRWQPQVARLLSYHVAFTLIYIPGWLAMAIILRQGVFARTSIGIVLVLHILAGLSLASFGLFVAAFFRKAQLSGITAVILSLLLAVLAQVLPSWNNAGVVICSLLFPSMNYTFFIIYMARFERLDTGVNLTQVAPESSLSVPGIVLFILFVVQILVYPVLAAMVERLLWGTTSGSRKLLSRDSTAAVEITNFSKHYKPNFFERHVFPIFGKKKKETVIATDNVSLKILPGQLTVLLGANGSGKSTTLDAIAGLSHITKGSISLDFGNGLGLCPQQNVLWKELTCYEHIDIFNRLKSVGKPAGKAENVKLIKDCDLEQKIHAKAGSLSGGQMRKLQLSIMFTGGSRLCLIDECSSGIDPIARRKVQNILLAERSRSNRTMIFTSHYLDEADIADKICIMSRGKLCADGTAPEIKSSGVYRIYLYHTPQTATAPPFEGYERQEKPFETIYSVETATEAATLLSKIEEQGIYDEYQISGPTIEDAFMKVAEEMSDLSENTEEIPQNKDEKLNEDGSQKPLRLQSGNPIGPFKQAWILFRKRITVFRRNFLPNTVAFLIIPIAAGLVALFLKGYKGAGCRRIEQVRESNIQSLQDQFTKSLDIVLGPPSKLGLGSFALLSSSITFGGSGGGGNGSSTGNLTGLIDSIHQVPHIEDFTSYVINNYANVTPGGFFLGENGGPATFAYKANGGMFYPFLIQNILDTLLSNISISAQYRNFDIPWQDDQGSTLQFAVYFGLALSVYPAFFALYPCLERLNNVRGLHFSNGVRALPLWQAYILFDFLFVLLGTVIAIVILHAASKVFFGLGYLFLVLLLYGLVSTLFAYIVSLFAKSQLAAFATAAAYQDVSLLLYMIAYLTTLTYAPVDKIDGYLMVVHYTLSLIFPTGSLMRSLFVSLNILSINCRDQEYVSSPSEFGAYGGPIAYLIVQAIVLFTFLVWWEMGTKFSVFRRNKYREPDKEEKESIEPEVAEEVARVQDSTTDGLRVLHLSKSYGKNLAVSDISFGVKRGEVFALLGPNGAGKSTTISVIRGDIKPSNNGGDVFIENISLRKKRTAARQNLGVCPQHDCMDQMTVLEHLRFYARVRGVESIEDNVQEVIRAVGLTKFKTRMGNALSGGNKRKLSLAIALMGNPGVMLLDEPSSGMDVAAKRILWKTLESVVPGRSIVLTTHSMEEADRLCQRAGIMARKMLALGTSNYLRKKHGDRYHVHLLLKSAPYTTPEEAEKARQWVLDTFSGVETEDRALHGQLRFSVPANSKVRTTTNGDEIKPVGGNSMAGIASLFDTLEKNKEVVGFQYYSVSQTTLDQVFLGIVSKHNVQEENSGDGKMRKERKGFFGLGPVRWLLCLG